MNSLNAKNSLDGVIAEKVRINRSRERFGRNQWRDGEWNTRIGSRTWTIFYWKYMITLLAKRLQESNYW